MKIRAHGLSKIFAIIFFSLFTVLLIAGEVLLIYDVANREINLTLGIILILFGMFPISLFVMGLIKQTRKYVYFTDEYLFVPDDFYIKNIFNKIQHKISVRYQDIESVSFLISNKDTHQNTINGFHAPMLNLVIKAIDKEYILNLYYYSEKQIARILDLLKNKVAEHNKELFVGNGLSYLKDFLQKQNSI